MEKLLFESKEKEIRRGNSLIRTLKIKKKRILTLALMGIMCCMVFIGCGGKTDLEKMIGVWYVDDLEEDAEYSFQDFTVEFYEPNEKDGTVGNFRYANDSGSERKGEYNYHESSKTLEMAFYDEFGVKNDWTVYMTFQVEFVEDDVIEMQEDKASIKLTRIDN